ncbi:MAG: sigma-54-dependent transcriptional regulator [Planctomycetota bacterium JB042]
MSAARLLLVDDEETQREMLASILGRAGYEVEAAADGRAALERLEAATFDLVLSDQRMPGLDGLELLRRVRATPGAPPVILMTAFGSVSSAVEAMKHGAADYLTKPFEKEELLLVLDKVHRQRSLEEEVVRLRSALADRVRLEGIVGASPPMQEVYSVIERVADTDVSVLVTGESGTGKELVARAIHARSRRADGPFVAINCAAVPETLLESEFFGHERGAFSGATQARSGAFERADGGTLLLDEIGAMRVDLQAKLLRVLQEREVHRLGADRPRRVDVRIVAATSEDLEESIRERSFREDLFYRLNVVPIALPPLRDRAEDVPVLLEHFARLAAARFDRDPPEIDSEVVERCLRHAWPGNVRELQNCVERMVVLARGSTLTPDDLPPVVRDGPGEAGTPDGFDLPAEGVVLDELERHLILQALRRSGGSLGPAARLVGITYKTLQYRIRKHRIERAEWAREGADPAGPRVESESRRPQMG